MFVRLTSDPSGKRRPGKWTDAATGEHGDLLDVIREVGAVTLALLTGGAALAAARIAFSLIQTPFLRFILALLFTAPAALAGYAVTRGLAALTMPS